MVTRYRVLWAALGNVRSDVPPEFGDSTRRLLYHGEIVPADAPAEDIERWLTAGAIEPIQIPAGLTAAATSADGMSGPAALAQ